MSYPNLSELTLKTDAKLFDHVAQRGGGKAKCVKHIEPVITADDEDPDVNCAVDGYLMYKSIEDQKEVYDYFGKDVPLTVHGQNVTLTPLLKRTRAAADRESEFRRRHLDWINTTFPIVCARGTGLAPITWDSYGNELAKITDWYFLDEMQKRGHLFIQVLDSPKQKSKMHMPLGGVFGGRYLYIALVCAAGGTGYGKFLMSMAEAACRTLGCEGIALASMSNSVGFYYSLGYKFVSKWDGVPLDVSAWTEVVTLPDGRVKTLLRPDLDVNPFAQPQRGSKRSSGESEQLAEEKERVETLYDQAVKKARSLYRRLTALSFLY